MFSFNRQKAEEIVKNRLRMERAPILEELDIVLAKAVESGEDASWIVEKKQALRDVTKKDLSGLSLEKLASLTLEDAITL